MKIAVVGAHLRGQPLYGQLESRQARLVAVTRTTPHYKLYALSNTTPPKPGLVRTKSEQGKGIEVEVYELEPAEFASFVEMIPAPMCIGTLNLQTGESVKGFLVEPIAVEGALDITDHGGWRAFLKSLQP